MKVNIIVGLTAFVITFFVSQVHNTLNTALFRSGVGFILFFLLGYLLRFVLHQIQSKTVPILTTDHRSQDRIIHVAMEEHEEQVKQTHEEPSFQSIPINSLHQKEDNGRI